MGCTKYALCVCVCATALLQVGDCAEHPADIKVTTWSNKTCATCDEEVYTGAQPEISCFEDGSTVGVTSTTTSSSSIGDGSGSGSGSGTGEGGGSGDESSATPVPTPVGDEDAVASPEAAVDDDDDDDDGDDNSEGTVLIVIMTAIRGTDVDRRGRWRLFVPRGFHDFRRRLCWCSRP